MICQACGWAMELLFSHYSCPVCHPPGTPHTKSTVSRPKPAYRWSVVLESSILSRHVDGSFFVEVPIPTVEFFSHRGAAEKFSRLRVGWILAIVVLDQYQIDTAMESSWLDDCYLATVYAPQTKYYLSSMADQFGLDE